MALHRQPSAFLTFGVRSSVDAALPRLYCFAFAGGAASVYASWARALSPEIAVHSVELPGHGARFDERPLETVAAMAESVAHAILAEESVAPCVFYGHSLGAVVAFETARLLQEESRPLPTHLFAGAVRAPHLPSPLTPISDLPQEEFLKEVQQRYGGLPAALFEEPELLEMVLPLLRADFRAYETYRYTGSDRLACPITAIYGVQDTVVRNDAVQEWSRVTSGAFRLKAVDGDHFFLNNRREMLLNEIRQCFRNQARGTADESTSVTAVR